MKKEKTGYIYTTLTMQALIIFEIANILFLINNIGLYGFKLNFIILSLFSIIKTIFFATIFYSAFKEIFNKK